MALESNVELLGRVPIFQGLSQDRLTAIVNKSKKTFFETGSEIISAGKATDSAYLILSGCAVTQPAEGEDLEAERLGPGTLLGELAMLVETIHSLTVSAEERVRALAINRVELVEVMEADPSIAHHFSEKLMVRLTTLAQDLREVDAKFASLEATLDQALASVA